MKNDRERAILVRRAVIGVPIKIADKRVRNGHLPIKARIGEKGPGRAGNFRESQGYVRRRIKENEVIGDPLDGLFLNQVIGDQSVELMREPKTVQYSVSHGEHGIAISADTNAILQAQVYRFQTQWHG
jgi:hypothetical protein